MDNANLPLDLAAVGQLLGGLKPQTVTSYRKRYASTHPFPTPAGHVGQSPFWTSDQIPDIQNWNAKRVGQGIGGGRPKHRQGKGGDSNANDTV